MGMFSIDENGYYTMTNLELELDRIRDEVNRVIRAILDSHAIFSSYKEFNGAWDCVYKSPSNYDLISKGDDCFNIQTITDKNNVQQYCITYHHPWEDTENMYLPTSLFSMSSEEITNLFIELGEKYRKCELEYKEKQKQKTEAEERALLRQYLDKYGVPEDY